MNVTYLLVILALLCLTHTFSTTISTYLRYVSFVHSICFLFSYSRIVCFQTILQLNITVKSFYLKTHVLFHKCSCTHSLIIPSFLFFLFFLSGTQINHLYLLSFYIYLPFSCLLFFVCLFVCFIVWKNSSASYFNLSIDFLNPITILKKTLFLQQV